MYIYNYTCGVCVCMQAVKQQGPSNLVFTGREIDA